MRAVPGLYIIAEALEKPGNLDAILRSAAGGVGAEHPGLSKSWLDNA